MEWAVSSDCALDQAASRGKMPLAVACVGTVSYTHLDVYKRQVHPAHAAALAAAKLLHGELGDVLAGKAELIHFPHHGQMLARLSLIHIWSENIDGALPDDVIRIDMQKGEAETERIIAIDGIEL